MSELFTNRTMEYDMTRRFLCELFMSYNNNIEVVQTGMDPKEIWQAMGYQAFSETIIPQIINRLIENNQAEGMVKYNEVTNRVTLTDEGRIWGDLNCRRML